ncbi:hypothetical protein NA57DRAFT_77283 [Rhizodiscina lignyota]|uniref:Uncharacterized protein n=1 Tax=Rhizodiscina lignyota TaxID=1504668 RepID=A0A9P4M3S5_9PEZI|nr:hypothetical protein NA57DRAFT_77283 [Rhizodiscina lignyota]
MCVWRGQFHTTCQHFDWILVNRCSSLPRPDYGETDWQHGNTGLIFAGGMGAASSYVIRFTVRSHCIQHPPGMPRAVFLDHVADWLKRRLDEADPHHRSTERGTCKTEGNVILDMAILQENSKLRGLNDTLRLLGDPSIILAIYDATRPDGCPGKGGLSSQERGSEEKRETTTCSSANTATRSAIFRLTAKSQG